RSRPELPRLGPSRFGVGPAPAPTPRGQLAHAVFQRLASPVLSFSRCGDAARAGHSWPVLCAAHVPDSRIGQLSRPDRDRQSPGDARGIHISPFAVLLSSAGENAFGRPSHPPAVSPLAAASFIVAQSTFHGGPRVCGRGSWGLAP